MKTYGELKKALKVKSLNWEQRSIDGVPSKWKSTSPDKGGISKIVAKVDCKVTDNSPVVELKPGEWLVKSEYKVSATFTY